MLFLQGEFYAFQEGVLWAEIRGIGRNKWGGACVLFCFRIFVHERKVLTVSYEQDWNCCKT